MNQTTDCKQLLGLHNLFSELVETKQSKSSPFSIARNISIWLSHQHLIIFGFIPYTVTIIFNVLLIHYLRSLPWFHPKQKCGNKVCFKKNTKYNPKILMSLNKCCMSMFQRSGKCKSKKEEKIKSYDHQINIEQSLIPCKCILHSENNPVIIGTTCSHSLNKRKQIHKFVKMFDNNNHNQNIITMYCPISNHHVISSCIGPHTWDGTLNNYNDNNNNNNKMKLKHFQSSTLNETPSNNSRYSSCVSIKLDNSQIRLCSQHFDDDDDNVDNDGCRNRDENINSVHYYSQSKNGCNSLSNRQNTDIHILLHKYRSNSVKTGWFVGQRRTTILLLVVTFTFVGLTLPYLIYVELKQVSHSEMNFKKSYHFLPVYVLILKQFILKIIQFKCLSRDIFNCVNLHQPVLIETFSQIESQFINARTEPRSVGLARGGLASRPLSRHSTVLMCNYNQCMMDEHCFVVTCQKETFFEY